MYRDKYARDNFVEDLTDRQLEVMKKNVEKDRQRIANGDDTKDSILNRRIAEIERLKAGKQTIANLRRLNFVMKEYQMIIEINEREIKR